MCVAAGSTHIQDHSLAEGLAEALSSLAWGSVDEESGEWARDSAPVAAFRPEAL